MISVKVKFFAMCREVSRCDEVVLDLPDKANESVLWVKMTERFPALETFKSQSRLAVNMAYVKDQLELRDGDEICIIPPVSGG